jgi:hypothetical protein
MTGCLAHRKASVSQEIYPMETITYNEAVQNLDSSETPAVPCPSAAAIVPIADLEEHQSLPSRLERLERSLQSASTSEELKHVR